METDAYIAIGSNLGDRELNLLSAVAELGKLEKTRVTALSSFYETSPVGMPEETPAFYNAVVRLATMLPAEQLLLELQRIERERFGRIATQTMQSRRMDLDLLLYGDLRQEHGDLTVPHPRMTERHFVLVPLIEIAPDLQEPGTGHRFGDLLAQCRSNEQIRKVE